MLQLYDKLISLPLFTGIGNDELSEIIAHIKFGFHQLEEGEYICKEDSKCERLLFITDGELSAITHSDDHIYSIQEELQAPLMVQPIHFFGVNQRYTKTFRAKTRCNLLSLEKSEVLKLIENSLIFRLNYFNLISTEAQKSSRLVWTRKPEDRQKAFVRFVRQHCMQQSGKKILRIKMIHLAYEIHESRLNVSKMLNKLEQEGLLTISRGIITIPHLENLR